MPRLALIFLHLASGGGSNGLGRIRAPSSLMALSTSYSGHALADGHLSERLPSMPVLPGNDRPSGRKNRTTVKFSNAASEAHQKCLATTRMSSTAAETAVTATMLTRLCVAIDSDGDTYARVRLVFVSCALVFVMPALQSQDGGLRPLGGVTLTLSRPRFVPDPHPPCHGLERKRLRGLVNQS
jgi:hypothetical protein